MFDKKFWISFVALLVITMTGGFLTHGLWLVPDYAALPNIMRGEEDANAHFQYMLMAHVLIAGGLAWIYRVGRKDGDWMGQGLRFGFAIALVSSVPFFMIYHAVAQFPFDLMVKQIIGDTVTLLAAGVAVAYANK